MNYPLEQTLVRVCQLSEYLKAELGMPSGADWVAAAELASGALRLEEPIAHAQTRLRTKAVAIIGSAVLQSYQWPLISTAVAASGCWPTWPKSTPIRATR